MNIYDIADEAGVSISTVSRVLNNRSHVKPETRKKVEDILTKHNYTPSAIARGLVLKNMNTIGIITIDIRVPHYAATAYVLERELYKLGYNSILCNTGGNVESGADYIQMLNKKGVSGIILIGSVFQNKYIETSLIQKAYDLPFIVINSELRADNTYSVMLNHDQAVALCINHLKDRGYKELLFVQDAESFSGNRKAESFLRHMKKNGSVDPVNSVFKTIRGVEGGKAVIEEILASGTNFDAIIFGSDVTAVGGIQRLKEKKLRIPKDVAVIGWNNSEYSTAFSPALTTVDNQDEMLASISVKMLENLLSDVPVSKQIQVDSSLIFRETT
ncbi:MAG: LacI family transcriptional regulator [Clostridiales Family XIII bacterium]|jgi:LacI family transcriptional regulator|nr:LacI family transcriptional regulator [Clostridiales Family XIII bacterium]